LCYWLLVVSRVVHFDAELLEYLNRFIHGGSLNSESGDRFLNLEHPVVAFPTRPLARLSCGPQLPGRLSVLDPCNQISQGYLERAGHLQQIPETHILLAALNLTNVRAMQTAHMCELLLGPTLGHPKIVEPFTETCQ
jgi:hypothetical protein